MYILTVLSSFVHSYIYFHHIYIIIPFFDFYAIFPKSFSPLQTTCGTIPLISIPQNVWMFTTSV